MKKIFAGLIAACLASPAFADSTIDGLIAAGALAGTENVPIFQTANPAVKTTTAAIGNTANALAGSVITSGTINAARLPNPTASTLGGVESLVSTAHQWINTISTSGVPSSSQPAFTDISGSVAASQMPALTGDITTSAGAVATALATVNSNVGSFTNANITVNAKGLVTAAANGTGGSSTNAPSHPGYVASVWYPAMGQGPVIAGTAASVTVTYCAPIGIGTGFGVNAGGTLTALGTRTTTNGTSNIQLALYNDVSPGSSAPHRPGTVVAHTSDIPNNAGPGGVQGATSTNPSVAPGFYWGCIQANDVTVRWYSQVNTVQSSLIYSTTSSELGSATLSTATGGAAVGVSFPGTYGTWVTGVGATFTEGIAQAPYFLVEFSSIP